MIKDNTIQFKIKEFTIKISEESSCREVVTPLVRAAVIFVHRHSGVCLKLIFAFHYLFKKTSGFV